MSCADQAILGQNLTFYIQSVDSSNTPTDANALPTYSVYEDGTGTAIETGTMAKLDDAGTAGFYSETLSITTANGYDLWESYTIRTTTTVGATPVVVTDSFNIVQTALTATTTSGALTTVANFKTYTGVTTSDDDALLTALIARATSAIEAYCGRTLTSTTYREFYDGPDDRDLWLDQTPITAIQLVATGRRGMVSVTNINADAWNAYANVDATNLELVVQGGANDGTDTLTLASYTLTTLVAAINALGTGWTAELLDSDKGTWEAVELLPIAAVMAFDPTVSNLSIPDDVKSGFTFESKSGRIHLDHKFALGHDNVIIRYTAGYATTPADLEQITIDLVNTYYRSRELDTTVMEESLGDHKRKFSDREGVSGSYRDIPKSLRMRLGPYKRFRI